MQTLNAYLDGKTASELRDIAREFKFSGFYSLNKEELVAFISQNMKSKDFEEKVKEKLNESMLLYLNIIFETGDSICYNDLKLEFLELRSLSTFYKLNNYLSTLGIIYETEDKNGLTLFFIPKEISKWLKKFVEEKISTFKPEDKIMEIEEEIEEDLILYSSFKTVEGLFFSSFLPIIKLKQFLKDKNMDSEGSKKELIERAIYKSGLEPEKLMDELFLKSSLRDININLQTGSKSGSKLDLINRILEKLDFQKPNLIKKVQDHALKSVSSRVKPPKIKPPTPDRELKIQKRTDEKILYKNPEKLISYLKTLRIIKPRDERDLAQFLNGILIGKFGDKTKIEESARRGKNRYDITLADEVLIELKVAKNKKTVTDGMGQIMHYLEEQKRYKYGILGVYDETTSKNLKSQFHEKYPNFYIVFW